MVFKKWKNEIMTVPNLLSLVRLLLIPVYTVLYSNAMEPRHYFTAGLIVSVSCLTDLLDGWIARRFDMVTSLGKVLDPLADKATQLTLTVCLSLKHPILRGVLLLFLLKEGFQLLAGILFLRKGKALTGALFIGKLCTTVYFASLIAMVLLPDLPAGAVGVFAAADFLLLLASFAGYILAYAGKTGKMQSIRTND